MRPATIVGAGVLACALNVLPAGADYVSIEHNVSVGVDDVQFDAPTGVLSIHVTSSDDLVLNDPTPLTGEVSNTVFNLETTFDSITPGGMARFTGGAVSLAFGFDAGEGAVAHEIAGPIDAMLFEILQVGSTSQINGFGHWRATTVNLPGSNVWVAPMPLPAETSAIEGLRFTLDENLGDFNWDRNLAGRVESRYVLFPGVIPEPATFGGMVVGLVCAWWSWGGARTRRRCYIERRTGDEERRGRGRVGCVVRSGQSRGAANHGPA